MKVGKRMLTFSRVEEKDEALVLEWLHKPHVNEWYHGQGLQNTIKGLRQFILLFKQLIQGNVFHAVPSLQYSQHLLFVTVHHNSFDAPKFRAHRFLTDLIAGKNFDLKSKKLGTRSVKVMLDVGHLIPY